jgi:hypothetical protein
MGMDVAAGDPVPECIAVDSALVGAFVGGRVFVGRMYIVGVARMGVAVSVGCRILVGMGAVFVTVGMAAALGRRMITTEPQRPRTNKRLRQPITAVPARLEFENLLMMFIPFILCNLDRALSAVQIIR